MTMSFPGEDGREEPGFKHGDDDAAPRSGAAPMPGIGQRPFDTRFEETGELDLGEEDVRLPWLEGDDDDYEDAGSNTSQLIALVLLGLMALALIVGGIWWLQRDKPDTTLVADGETIQAPAAPYKTKPANPGGEVVAGTGDTSFAVAEGQTRQVRMGSDAPAPASTPKAAATPSASPSAGASQAAPADVSGVGVQVGAYSNRGSAEAGWTRLSSQYEALGTVKHRIVEGRADIGTVYRLQAVPGDAAAANRLCGSLKAAGLSCQVKR